MGSVIVTRHEQKYSNCHNFSLSVGLSVAKVTNVAADQSREKNRKPLKSPTWLSDLLCLTLALKSCLAGSANLKENCYIVSERRFTRSIEVEPVAPSVTLFKKLYFCVFLWHFLISHWKRKINILMSFHFNDSRVPHTRTICLRECKSQHLRVYPPLLKLLRDFIVSASLEKLRDRPNLRFQSRLHC